MARALGGRWMATARTPLAGISPWPMVVVLRDGSAWDPIGKVYKRLELGDSEYIPAYFAAAARRRGDGDDDEDERRAVVLPITGELDLHAFAPRDAVSVVEDYLDECRRRGLLEVRIVHGRGRGVRRAEVRRALARRADVLVRDARPLSGGWGAHSSCSLRGQMSAR